MTQNNTSVIIKEYYNIISPMLVFTPCGQTDEIERQVLQLLCKSELSQPLFDKCLAMVEEARCLQIHSDGSLLLAEEEAERSIAYDIKMEVLTQCKISKVRTFDEYTFLEDLKNNANIGDKNACKLLASLCWLGVLMPQNRETAIRIWSVLAMSGDRAALEMLIYAYGETGNTEQLEKWQHICDILQKEMDAFSAIAQHVHYPDYTEQEVQTANLIMFISQKTPTNETAVNRPMLHYVLHSADDYSTKMQLLSDQTNYFLAMYHADKLSNKEYGF